MDLNEDAHEEQRKYESEEVLVVPLADASANPRAVVVEALDASVALVAVGGPRRAVDETSRTELESQQMGLDSDRVHFLLVHDFFLLVAGVERNA